MRYLSIFLVLLLLPALIVPAAATETEGYANFVDLMAQGYITVDGVQDTDFRFTGAAANVVEFPVDVIGGMGEVEFVIYSPDTNITITSQNGVAFTKVAMAEPNLYYFYADVGRSTIEKFTFNCPAGYQVYIVSARARMTGDLISDLEFDISFRIGSYKEEFTDYAAYRFYDTIADYFEDTSDYTKFVSSAMTFDGDDLLGLDYLDYSLFTTGMTSTSITAITTNNVYLPVDMSFMQSADPAVERDRYSIHVDLSDLPAYEDVVLYFYGVTTSSSGTVIWEVPRVVGGVTQPEVSGEVGLLGKIWIYLSDKLPLLDSIDSTLTRIYNSVHALLAGEPDHLLGPTYDVGSFENDISDDVTEATEILDIMEDVTKPNEEDLEDLGDISDLVNDSDIDAFAEVFAPFMESQTFSTVLTLSFTFAIIAYVLYGKG